MIVQLGDRPPATVEPLLAQLWAVDFYYKHPPAILHLETLLYLGPALLEEWMTLVEVRIRQRVVPLV